MQLTADEIETVKALITDWGFEYSLRADKHKVLALTKKLGVTRNRPPMTPEQDYAVQLIMKTILALPSYEQRQEVFSAVRFNDIFCVECGYGSLENPNPNCQCE